MRTGKRLLAAAVLPGAALLLLGAAAPAALGEPATSGEPAAPAPKPKQAKPAPPPAIESQPTPMNERVATIAALNKQNGRTQTFEAKPGESVRFDRLSIHVRACETTPPWEDKLSGAFVQIDERKREGGRESGQARVFSGWLFAEAPALNVFENPVYDVWVKSCAMNFPGIGAEQATSPAQSSSGASKSGA